MAEPEHHPWTIEWGEKRWLLYDENGELAGSGPRFFPPLYNGPLSLERYLRRRAPRLRNQILTHIGDVPKERKHKKHS